MIVLDASVVIVALPSAQRCAAHLPGRPAVGHERVHARLRQPAASRRPDRRLPRTPTDVHRRPARVRGRFCAGRAGPGSGDAVRSPGAARRVRRHHGARRVVAADRHLHRSPRAGPRLRRLRRHRGWRRGYRVGPRRHLDAVGVVALDPADQRADRAAGRSGRQPGHPRESRRAPGRLRHPRRAHRDRRACSCWSTASPPRAATAGPLR